MKVTLLPVVDQCKVPGGTMAPLEDGNDRNKTKKIINIANFSIFLVCKYLWDNLSKPNKAQLTSRLNEAIQYSNSIRKSPKINLFPPPPDCRKLS